MLSKMPSAVRCLRRFLLSGLTNFSLSSTSGWHAKWSKCTRWEIMASTGCSASKADWSRHTGVHPFEGYWPTSVCHQQVAGMQNDQKCTRWAIMAATGCSASKAGWSRHGPLGVDPFEGLSLKGLSLSRLLFRSSWFDTFRHVFLGYNL